MKQSFVTEPSVTIIQAEGDIAEGQPHESEYEVPEGATHAIVLVERLAGEGRVTVRLDALTTEEREELSRLEQVRVRFMRLASNAQTIGLKVSSSAKAVVRVTVAFVRREATSLRKNFSCRACKQLCRLAISALLAHLGIPFLDVEASEKNLPEVAPPNESTGPWPPITSLEDFDKRTRGAAVPLSGECRAWLERPETAPDWMREMFDLIDPKAMAAVHGVLNALGWMFEGPDRVYTAVCLRVGLCKPQLT